MEISRYESVAIVGASENNFFAMCVLRNLGTYGYAGQVFPINPRAVGTEIHGHHVYGSLVETPSVPAVVVIAVQHVLVEQVVRESLDRGSRCIVILADGFAETGQPELVGLQREITRMCDAASAELYGPNGVGFGDFAEGFCAIAEPLPANIATGDVSIISQSGGGLASVIASAIEDGLGLDWCASIGNGAQIDFSLALEMATDRPTTRFICAYVESLGTHPEAIRKTVERGRAQGKHYLFVKSGRSGAAQELAVTHTASVAGEDAAVGAFLRELGVIRSLDVSEMARTVAVLRMVGDRDLVGKGVAIVATSGGTAALCADLAHLANVELASYSAETTGALRELTSSSAYVGNPTDLTATGGGGEGVRRVLEQIQLDPGVGFVILPFTIDFPDESEARVRHRRSLQWRRDAAVRTDTPTLVTSMVTQPWTDWLLGEFRGEEAHVGVVRGMLTTLSALAHLFPAGAPESPIRATPGGITAKVSDEAEGRRILDTIGAPLVRGRHFVSPAEAAAGVAGLRPPFAMKILADGVAHKSRVGGVELGCLPDEVESAGKEIINRVLDAGVSPDQINGLLVEEMVSGPELLIGLQRDATLGGYLTFGMGGVLSEYAGLKDTRLLPMDAEQARASLAESGLGGIVASEHHDALIRLLLLLSDEFTNGRLADYDAVELNPVVVSANGPQIADVVLVSAAATST